MARLLQRLAQGAAGGELLQAPLEAETHAEEHLQHRVVQLLGDAVLLLQDGRAMGLAAQHGVLQGNGQLAAEDLQRLQHGVGGRRPTATQIDLHDGADVAVQHQRDRDGGRR